VKCTRIEKGIETTIKIARRALARKMPVADIAEFTGLTEADIEALKPQQN
jgi:hypothetical protein